MRLNDNIQATKSIEKQKKALIKNVMSAKINFKRIIRKNGGIDAIMSKKIRSSFTLYEKCVTSLLKMQASTLIKKYLEFR
jgi:hypothetical protein